LGTLSLERENHGLKVFSDQILQKPPESMTRKRFQTEYGERFAPLSAPRDILEGFRIIWVEPRERALAPVGENFCLNLLIMRFLGRTSGGR
jgi:hypothetical protein